MALNKKGGTKCAACETEQPGNEGNLYVSVSEYGREALVPYRIGIGGFKFGELRLKEQSDGSSVRSILKVYALKRERDQEILSLKEGSSLHPLRQGRSSKAHIKQSSERNTGLNLLPIKSTTNWRLKRIIVQLVRNWGEIGEKKRKRELLSDQ